VVAPTTGGVVTAAEVGVAIGPKLNEDDGTAVGPGVAAATLLSLCMPPGVDADPVSIGVVLDAATADEDDEDDGVVGVATLADISLHFIYHYLYHFFTTLCYFGASFCFSRCCFQI